MGKMREFIFFILILTVVFFGLSCGSKKAVTLSEKSLFVTATVIKGKVEYKMPDGKEWKIAKVGDKFKEATQIKVSENGFLVLEYPGKYKTSISGGTVLSIKKLKPAKKKGFFSTAFSVLKGMIYSSVTINTKEGDSYEVETPQAVCGVYGTRFCVDCPTPNRMRLFVEQHTVWIRKPHQAMEKAKRIKEGYMVVVQNGHIGSLQPFNVVNPPYAKIFNGMKIEETMDRGDIKINNH
jgi:hypothetical protein